MIACNEPEHRCHGTRTEEADAEWVHDDTPMGMACGVRIGDSFYPTMILQWTPELDLIHVENRSQQQLQDIVDEQAEQDKLIAEIARAQLLAKAQAGIALTTEETQQLLVALCSS